MRSRSDIWSGRGFLAVSFLALIASAALASPPIGLSTWLVILTFWFLLLSCALSLVRIADKEVAKKKDEEEP